MSRTIRNTIDQRETGTAQRGQYIGRPVTRRTGTRAAVIAAELASYGYDTDADALAIDFIITVEV